MSAQQNQLKDVSDRDFISFMNSYRHIPVSPSQCDGLEERVVLVVM